MRHFGLTSGRDAGGSHPVRSHGATHNTGANVIELPVGGRSARRPTGAQMRLFSSPRHWLTQLAIDLLAVASALLVIVVTAISFPLAIGMLFFGSF